MRVTGEGVRDEGPDGLDHLGGGLKTRDWPQLSLRMPHKVIILVSTDWWVGGEYGKGQVAGPVGQAHRA